MKRTPNILIISCGLVGLSCARAMMRHPEVATVILVNDFEENKEDYTELLKREPIPIKCFDDFTRVEDYTIYPQTKPIDAIASRHKYPRKKNEW